MVQHKEELAAIEALDNGRPITWFIYVLPSILFTQGRHTATHTALMWQLRLRPSSTTRDGRTNSMASQWR
jgi:hypothetical protein